MSGTQASGVVRGDESEPDYAKKLTFLFTVRLQQSKYVVGGQILLGNQALLRIVLQVFGFADELGKKGQVPLIIHLHCMEEADKSYVRGEVEGMSA